MVETNWYKRIPLHLDSSESDSIHVTDPVVKAKPHVGRILSNDSTGYR